ncbi:MAG TPA: type 1 glutamine amidotransferase [Burkholderiaceae bacterium]|nr:type 1 glutamine amidotransferase [Burkholderiaceae bacterium]
MRPILVIQHAEGDGPGHFGEWLALRGRPTALVRVHAGDPVPAAVEGHAGLCVLGGPMSANDDHLDHVRAELGLLRDALDRRVPVIGHCLGGQLLARVLGAPIGRSPAPEIGWHAIEVADDPEARRWFGEARRPVVVQWHHEAFGLPAGAIALAGSAACPRQAFSWDGVHLGMQFHPEADRAKLAFWLGKHRREPEVPSRHPTVQSAARIAGEIDAHLDAMRALAHRLYDAWGRGLVD